MKKIPLLLGVTGAILLMTGGIFKIMHFPGAGPSLILGWTFFLAGFLPILIKYFWSDNSSEKNVIKTTPKILGLIGAIFLMSGVLFKMMHFPGAGPLILFSHFLLVFGFFPFLMSYYWKQSVTNYEKLIAVVNYFLIFLALTGFLFKIMHFPGAGPMVILWYLFMIIIFIPLHIINVAREKNKEFKQTKMLHFIYMTFIVGFVFMFFGINVQKSVLDSFSIVDESLIHASHIMETKNIEYYQKLTDISKIQPEKGVIAEKTRKVKQWSDDLYKYIQDLKVKLIMRVDNPDKIEEKLDSMGNVVAQSIEGKDNLDIGGEIMIVNGEGAKLKVEILTYRQHLLDLFSRSTKQNLDKTITLNAIGTFDAEQGAVSWEAMLFEHLPFISVITNLTKLQGDVRYAEAQALEQLYFEALNENTKSQ